MILPAFRCSIDLKDGHRRRIYASVVDEDRNRTQFFFDLTEGGFDLFLIGDIDLKGQGISGMLLELFQCGAVLPWIGAPDGDVGACLGKGVRNGEADPPVAASNKCDPIA